MKRNLRAQFEEDILNLERDYAYQGDDPYGMAPPLSEDDRRKFLDRVNELRGGGYTITANMQKKASKEIRGR